MRVLVAGGVAFRSEASDCGVFLVVSPLGQLSR